MEITSFWPLFFFAVGVQGVFLSLILFLQKEANKSNFFLALLIALFSISIVDTIVFWAVCSCESPYWLGLSMIFIFLYGPLFYFFLSGFGREGIKGKWKHFLIAIIVLLWHIHFLSSAGANDDFIISGLNNHLINTFLLPAFGLISLIFYAKRSYYHIATLERKYEIKIIKSWHWLGLIFKAYLLFVSFYFVFFICIIAGISVKTLDIIIVLSYSIVIYSIGYLALKTSKLLNGIKVDTTKYQFASLPKNFSKSMYEKLKEHMAANKPYKKNEIKLAHLAEELSLSPHQLSQIINQNAHQNFAEFINAFRVKEAIELIAHMDRINQLAYEVGFNNRTTFNRVFKSATGYTPTEYKKHFVEQSVVEK